MAYMYGRGSPASPDIYLSALSCSVAHLVIGLYFLLYRSVLPVPYRTHAYRSYRLSQSLCLLYRYR